MFYGFYKALKALSFGLVVKPFSVYIIFAASIINYSQMLDFLTELLTF